MTQNDNSLIILLKTSTYLLTVIPFVRRVALEETLRNRNYDNGIQIFLENISDSPYIPNSQKQQFANLVFEQKWVELKQILQCVSHPDILANRNSFQRMVLSIFSKSKKIAELNIERRTQIGQAILQTDSEEQLKELAITSLESSETMDEFRRTRIANAIFDKRYDLLLLQDYFDCDEIPRKITQHLPEQVAQPLEEEEEECPVCLGTYPVDCQLSCRHKFCHRCINSWSHRQHSCPLCRKQQVSWEQVNHLNIPNRSQVRLHGLVSNTQLNGQTGTVLRFELSSGKFVVSLDSEQRSYKVKLDNIERLS